MIEVPRTATGPLTLESLGRAFVLFVDAVRATVNPALKKPILNGLLLTNVSIATAVVNAVPHGLGRKPVGWIVVSQPSNLGLYEPDKTTRTSTMIFLQSSGGTASVDIWVF